MDWIKYFFLSFFVDEYAEEAHKRSLLNSFLSLFLAICILCCALFWGYCAAMPKSYYENDTFREDVYSFLTKDHCILKHEDGKFSFIDANGNEAVTNTYGGDGDSLFIINTADIKSDFVEFYVSYIDSTGNEISYDEYLALELSEQSAYSFKVEYTDKLIEFNADQLKKYEAFLSSVEKEDVALQYSSLQKNISSLSDEEYAFKLYELYVIAYYPSDVVALDIYSFAPTLRTYYDDLIAKSMDKNFLALFDDLLYVRFEDENSSYILSGHSENFEDGVIIPSDSANALEIVDGLIFEAFEHSKTYIIIEYIFNFVSAIPIFVIATLLISVIPWIFFKLTKNKRMVAYLTSFKLLNLYSIVAALVAGVIGFAITPTLGRAEAYKASLLCFVLIITIRLVVYLIMRIFKREN